MGTQRISRYQSRNFRLGKNISNEMIVFIVFKRNTSLLILKESKHIVNH